MNKYTKNDYDSEFKDYSVDKKRADLECNPFFKKKMIKRADDKIIIQLHEEYFISFKNAMGEVLGE